ncbi:NAD-binding protein [Methanomethylovorans sp.]|uniref:NAD-binding protein n=1 Tax=Methanomethylovorans sp. TaxID=2758717 RepID=UPI00351C7C4A
MVTEKKLLSIRGIINGFMRTSIWKINRLASNYGLQAYAGLWISAMLLGYYGYSKYYNYGYYNHQFKTLLPWTEMLYQTFQLFALKSNIDWSIMPVIWQLEMARWMALLFTSVTAGMLLVFGFFSKKVHSLLLWTVNDHVIICGSGRIGSRLVREFSKKYPVVLIEQNKQSKTLESFLHSEISIVFGDAKDAHILKSAGIERAKYLITALGDDNANAEVAILAQRLAENRKYGRLTCFVNILDPKLCDLVKVKEFDYSNNENFELEFFNLYENGARLIFEKYPLLKNSSSKGNIHLLVVGLGNMGESLVIRAAKNWWSNYARTKNRLDITVVDRDARSKVQSMCLRYPKLGIFCNLMDENCDIHSSDFLETQFQQLLSGERPITAIFVCVMDDNNGLSTALLLHHYLGERNIPIIVRLNSDKGLSSLLTEQNKGTGFNNLHSFGLWDETCKLSIIDGTSQIIAQAIHEEYYSEQRKLGVKIGSKPTMYPWKELSEDIKASNLDAAHHVTDKMAAVLCSLSKLTDWEAHLFEFEPIEILRLGMLEHKRWCREKLREDWTYGEERNDAKKQHSSLVPWVELSVEDKKKDFDTIKKLPLVLSRVDIHIHRLSTLMLIAQALYKYDLVLRNIQKLAQSKASTGEEADDISWWNLSENINKEYLNKARIINTSLEKCGFDVTGYVENEPLSGIMPEDINEIAKKLYEMSLEKQAYNDGNSSIESWDNLSSDEHDKFTDEVKSWNRIFIGSKMQIYNIARQMNIYASDLKILDELRQEDKLKVRHPRDSSIKI